MDPRVKAALVSVGLVANLLAASPSTPLLMGLVTAVALARSGVHAGIIARRLILPWYIAFVALATQAVLVGATTAFAVGPVILHEEGLRQGILVASRVVGGTMLVLGLSLTTTTTELLALATHLRLPPELVEIAALIYRYLFLLLEEAGRISDAQKLRLGRRTWRMKVSSSASLAGMVLIRSYDRANTVYDAMTLRCYGGAQPVQSLSPLRRKDVLQGALFLAALLGICAVGSLPVWQY